MAEQNQQTATKTKKKTGLYIIGIALALLAVGYYVLTLVNSDASNWAGTVSPILIIGGYVTVAIGILVGWDE
jgi:flagellar basal body-associated protein FliL